MNTETNTETNSGVPPVRLRLDAGPDAGRTIALPGGPIVVGRLHGTGRVADPSLEAHHLLVDATRRTVVQLSGRAPVFVDGKPVGRVAAISDGSVIELGASRIVVVRTTPTTTRAAAQCGGGLLLLGVGVRRDHQMVGSSSFVDQARDERTRTTTSITLDLHETRRILVVGSTAESFAGALAARSKGPAIVADRLDLLRRRSRRRRLVIVHVADPETDWPGREMPNDAAVISIGVSWQAVLMRRAPDGSISLQRFHAAGHPGGPEPRSPAQVCSRLDRAFVAEEVARPGAELGGDVARVPEPARRQREAAAPDALVELVAHPGEQRDLLVEARPP